MATAESEDLTMSERSTDELDNQPGDAVADWWRSCEQVENETPSTSLMDWDSDDDYDGPKPSELHGRFTWKVENFSTISKRELRSNAFEVGGYKWYILIYPQGCDVCNHLSLFLCVANHEKLLPGWSHFAQFTIAVVNKDPKKSKYSDTLHRFWKKEHDWGWKKFMELSKVLDGFIVADTLVIKAQVQVIREKPHRLFRCLDCQYRRELIRVYLTNVEQVCRRFIEERREKIGKLIEDKVKWPSFCAFWLGIDQNIKRIMSREHLDVILKAVVKHFFIEKEVTSTLVMDSLYNGLRKIECLGKDNKRRTRLLEAEEPVSPLVFVEKDMFVLADDVFPLLERATSEPLPHQSLPPKDEKGSQNRIKDGSGEEFNKDSIQLDERRLTELGRRTVEMFVLTHIFGNRIEVAYQEAVAWKRQEELIREEEEAGLAGNEFKAKHGSSEKEKRSKKKQAKKRSGQKNKDRCRNPNSSLVLQEKNQNNGISNEKSLRSSSLEEAQLLDQAKTLEAVSNITDAEDEVVKAMKPDLDDRDCSIVNWDTDTSEIHLDVEANGSIIQNEDIERKSSKFIDDSSSTCSTDSVPSVMSNWLYKANFVPHNKSQTSPKRGKSQHNKEICDSNISLHGRSYMLSDNTLNSQCHSAKTKQSEHGALDASLKDRTQSLELQLFEKLKDQAGVSRLSKSPSMELFSSPGTWEKTSSVEQQPNSSENNTAASNTSYPVFVGEESSITTTQHDKPVIPATRSQLSPKFEFQRQIKPAKIIAGPAVTAVSRPLSDADCVSALMSSLPHSMGAAVRLENDASICSQNYPSPSYHNAIMSRNHMGVSPAGFCIQSPSSRQSVAAFSSSVLPSSAKTDRSPSRSSITFGSVRPDVPFDRRSQQPKDDLSCLLKGNQNGEKVNGGEMHQQQNKHETPSVSFHECVGMPEDFPHLDIINDLLDEEHGHECKTNDQQHHQQLGFSAGVAATEIASSSSPLDQPELYYNEYYQHAYGTSEGHLSQTYLPTYANMSQKDGLVQNQWPYRHADISNLSMLNLGSSDVNSYPYQIANYSSLTCGSNGYTVYRPATGI